MNTFSPVSTLMTRDLITVNPEDSLLKIQQIFDKHNIHHVPVVRFRKLVGLISKTDLLKFAGGLDKNTEGRFSTASKLNYGLAQDIMTTKLAKLEHNDRINVALEVFEANRFHALPIMDNGALVGILTPFDILKALNQEKPERPESVYAIG